MKQKIKTTAKTFKLLFRDELLEQVEEWLKVARLSLLSIEPAVPSVEQFKNSYLSCTALLRQFEQLLEFFKDSETSFKETTPHLAERIFR